MAGPNPFDAAFQVPEGVESFVWPSGIGPDKGAGGGVPQANPLGTDTAQAPINPLDLPPTAAPPSSGQPGAPPAQAPLPQPSLSPVNAPAAPAGGIGTNQELSPVERLLRSDESGDVSPVERMLRQDDVLTPDTPEHSAFVNWGAGALDSLLTRFSQGAMFIDKTGFFNAAMVRSVIETMDKKDIPPEGATEEFKKRVNQIIEAEPGSMLKDMARKIGITVDPDKDSIAGEIGHQTVDGLLFLAATAIAAPELGAGAAAINLPRVGRFLTKVGETIKASPVLSGMIDAFGATPGGVMGEHLTGSPWGAIPGALIGGSVFQMAHGIGGKTVRAVSKLVEPKGMGLPSSPILNKNHDVFFPAQNVTDAVQGAMTDAINKGEAALRAIKVPPNADPRFYQKAVHKGLQRMEDISERIRNRYWRQVDQDVKVDPKDHIRPALAKLIEDLKSRPFGRPDDLIEELGELTATRQGRDASGRLTKAPGVTVEQLMNFQTKLYHAMRSEEAAILQGRIPRREYVATVNDMRTIIYQAIERANPNDPALALARAYSERHHDIFSRGNVAEALSSSRQGEAAVNPEQTVDYFNKKYNGFKDLIKQTRQLANEAAVPGQRLSGQNAGPGGKWVSTNMAERSRLQKVVSDYENSMRAQVRQEIADSGFDQKTASRVIQKADRNIPTQSRLAAEFEKAAVPLNSAIEEQAAIRRGAMAQITGALRNVPATPQAFINSVFNGGEKTAREALVVLRSDPNAVQHLRDGLLDEIFRRSGGKPMELKNLTETEHVRRMMEAVLQPDQLARFRKVVDITSRIEAGDITTAKKYWMPTQVLAARFGGAAVAKMLGRVTGMGSTIQGTGAFAQAAKEQVVKFWGTRNPTDLLIKAIEDPTWERFVLSQEPGTPEAMRALIKSTHAVVRRVEATRNFIGANDQEGPSPGRQLLGGIGGRFSTEGVIEDTTRANQK